MNKLLAKKAWWKVLAALFAVTGLFFVSCGGGDSGGDSTPVTIKNVKITGTVRVGETVYANATDTSGATGEATNATYQWYLGDSEEGSFEAISDATAISYEIPEGTANKYLKVSASKNGSTEESEPKQIKDTAALDSVVASGDAKVGATLTAVAKDSDGEVISSGVSYQWYVSDSQSGGAAIEGATSAEYIIPADYDGRYLIVRASRNGSTKEYPTTQIQKGTLSGDYTLTYTVDSEEVSLDSIIVTLPDELSGTLTVSGLTDATSNLSVSGGTATFAKTTLTVSESVAITISASGYDSLKKDVFITVQAAVPSEEELPSLVTEGLSSISAGFTKFRIDDDGAESYSAYEFSADGGEYWQDITTDQFAVHSSEDGGTTYIPLKFRVKEVGTAGQGGYVMASDSTELEVTDNNIGTKPAAHVEVSLSGDISAPTQSSANGTVTLTAAEGYSNYKWYVDGEEVSGSAQNANIYDFATSDRNAGTYIITVEAGIYTASATVKVE